MTESDGNGAADADTGPVWGAPLQSRGSASNDEIGDSLELDGHVDGRDSADPSLSVAPSLPPVPRGRHRIGGDVVRAPSLSATSGDWSPASNSPNVAPEFSDELADEVTGRKGRRVGRRRRKAPWWELPVLVLVAILIAVLVKTFVVQPFYIPSQSMEKTLHGCPGCKGDRILVNKPIYDIRDPHPGDIVVFHAPDGWDDEPPSRPPSNPVFKVVRGFGQLVGFVPPDGLVLVKRVIAIGGQTVKGDSSGHVMVSNDGPDGPFRTLDEPYVFLDGVDTHAAFGPVTIPKDRLWVMGDHRSASGDSLEHYEETSDIQEATIPEKSVVGRAFTVFWPLSRAKWLSVPDGFDKIPDASAAK